MKFEWPPFFTSFIVRLLGRTWAFSLFFKSDKHLLKVILLLQENPIYFQIRLSLGAIVKTILISQKKFQKQFCHSFGKEYIIPISLFPLLPLCSSPTISEVMPYPPPPINIFCPCPHPYMLSRLYLPIYPYPPLPIDIPHPIYNSHPPSKSTIPHSTHFILGRGDSSLTLKEKNFRTQ